MTHDGQAENRVSFRRLMRRNLNRAGDGRAGSIRLDGEDVAAALRVLRRVAESLSARKGPPILIWRSAAACALRTI